MINILISVEFDEKKLANSGKRREDFNFSEIFKTIEALGGGFLKVKGFSVKDEDGAIGVKLVKEEQKNCAPWFLD